MKRDVITIQQKLNEHSAHVFIRARRRVRVGQVLRIVPAPEVGGCIEEWLKTDARSNNGTTWVTYLRARGPQVGTAGFARYWGI